MSAGWLKLKLEDKSAKLTLVRKIECRVVEIEKDIDGIRAAACRQFERVRGGKRLTNPCA